MDFVNPRQRLWAVPLTTAAVIVSLNLDAWREINHFYCAGDFQTDGELAR